MIRRDLHAICDNCWNKVAPRSPTFKDKHHFFTFAKNPDCCWCQSPSHGLWWIAPRTETPCTGMFGYHADDANIVDFEDMRKTYSEDPNVQTLIRVAQGLQAELERLTKGKETK